MIVGKSTQLEFFCFGKVVISKIHPRMIPSEGTPDIGNTPVVPGQKLLYNFLRYGIVTKNGGKCWQIRGI